MKIFRYGCSDNGLKGTVVNQSCNISNYVYCHFNVFKSNCVISPIIDEKVPDDELDVDELDEPEVDEPEVMTGGRAFGGILILKKNSYKFR